MQAGCIADRRHLDAGLGAIDEGIEHFRVDRLAIVDLEIFVENIPHRIGRGLVIGRVIARALPRRDDIEAVGARPIHLLADHGGLITPGERVNHPGRLGLTRQQRPGHRIGFHIHHHDMLAILDAHLRETDTSARIARRLDYHLDRRGA